MKARHVVGLTALVLAVVPALRAEDFRWQGRVAAGAAVEIKGVNGGIDAEPASGTEVEVTAVKRARRSNPDEVEIKGVEHAGGGANRAGYPEPARPAQPCRPRRPA